MLPFRNPNPHTLSIPFTSTDLIEIDPFPSISNSSFLQALSPCIDILPFDATATTMVPQLDPLLVLTNYTCPPLMMMRRPDKVRGPRKDRHSKIVTAKGPRDRRIRLSREVARNFFDLQEMLGFEHGSKTVQWLLTMSKHAIQELNTTTSPFIISENDCKGKAVATTLSYPSESIEKKQRQVAIEPPARVIYNINNNDRNHTDTFNYELLIAKESRPQARERTKNIRTTQKKRSNCCVLSSNIAPTIGAAKVDLHLTESVDQEGSSAECSVHLGFTAEEGDFGMVPICDCWTGENNSMEDISFQVQDIWRDFLLNDI